MKLIGISELIEGEDFIKYKSGHVIIKYNKLLRHAYSDSLEYKVVSDDNKSYRTILIYMSAIMGFQDPGTHFYYDEIKHSYSYLNLKKEIESIKEDKEFNDQFEELIK